MDWAGPKLGGARRPLNTDASWSTSMEPLTSSSTSSIALDSVGALDLPLVRLPSALLLLTRGAALLSTVGRAVETPVEASARER